MKRTFVVDGEPVGKGRPRFNTKSGRTYTPEKTVNYEAWVRYSYRMAYPDADLLQGQLGIRIIAYYSIPKSASKKKRLQMLSGEIRPTKKPDCDNVIKAICDALNGIAYHDDAAIVEVHFSKQYAEEPLVAVEISEDET